MASSSFNFCFWAKLIVAIPALPLAAFLAASLFEQGWVQMLAAGFTVALLVFLAVKIDKIPLFSRKIVERNGDKAP